MDSGSWIEPSDLLTLQFTSTFSGLVIIIIVFAGFFYYIHEANFQIGVGRNGFWDLLLLEKPSAQSITWNANRLEVRRISAYVSTSFTVEAFGFVVKLENSHSSSRFAPQSAESETLSSVLDLHRLSHSVTQNVEENENRIGTQIHSE